MIPREAAPSPAPSVAGTRVLALLPYLVDGAMPLKVFREMRRRGMEVVIAYYLDQAVGLVPDPCEDFARDGCLVDMTRLWGNDGVDRLETVIDRHVTQLVIQIGSPWGYSQLPALKERRPGLRIVDWLFNTGPHFQSFTNRTAFFDGCLVENDGMMRALAELPGAGTIRLIESGVDLAEFAPKGRSVETPSPDLVVGYLGRMSPEKNPLGFVEMAEGILAREHWVRFVIYGSGVQADEVQERVQASPARDSIVYRGFVDHPSDALAEIDVLVVPSILDGRPAAIMEANASGVPVIAAPVGGIPELISDGTNGYLVPPTDLDRLAGLLAQWRERPEAFGRLRSTTRALAEARFDRDRMMDGYATAFVEWIEAPARPLAVVEARSTPTSLVTAP